MRTGNLQGVAAKNHAAGAGGNFIARQLQGIPLRRLFFSAQSENGNRATLRDLGEIMCVKRFDDIRTQFRDNAGADQHLFMQCCSGQRIGVGREAFADDRYAQLSRFGSQLSKDADIGRIHRLSAGFKGERYENDLCTQTDGVPDRARRYGYGVLIVPVKAVHRAPVHTNHRNRSAFAGKKIRTLFQRTRAQQHRIHRRIDLLQGLMHVDHTRNRAIEHAVIHRDDNRVFISVEQLLESQ